MEDNRDESVKIEEEALQHAAFAAAVQAQEAQEEPLEKDPEDEARLDKIEEESDRAGDEEDQALNDAQKRGQMEQMREEDLIFEQKTVLAETHMEDLFPEFAQRSKEDSKRYKAYARENDRRERVRKGLLFAKACSELAAFYAAHPEVPVALSLWDSQVHLYSYLSDASKSEVKRLAKNLGSFKKSYSDDTLTYKKDLGVAILNFHLSRGAVCKKVIKGTKIVPAHTIPERIVPEAIEEIVEWVCSDPVLGAEDEEGQDA